MNTADRPDTSKVLRALEAEICTTTDRDHVKFLLWVLLELRACSEGEQSTLEYVKRAA